MICHLANFDACSASFQIKNGSCMIRDFVAQSFCSNFFFRIACFCWWLPIWWIGFCKFLFYFFSNAQNKVLCSKNASGICSTDPKMLLLNAIYNVKLSAPLKACLKTYCWKGNVWKFHLLKHFILLISGLLALPLS